MKLRLQDIPFVWLLVPLLGGIIGVYSINIPPFLSLVFICLSILLCGVGGYLKYKKGTIPSPLLYTIIALFIGVFSIQQTQRNLLSTSLPPAYTSTPAFYQVQLIDYPAPKAKTVMCNASLQYVKDSIGWQLLQRNIKLYIPKDSASLALRQGDILLVHTQLVQPQVKNPDDFDYLRHLHFTGYAATAYVATDHWEYIEHQTLRGMRAWAVQCRNYLYRLYQQSGLQGDELAIVSALTLGYTEDMNTSTRQSFTAAGAAHILAVSGMHTAIIFAVLWSFFTVFGLYPILYQQQWRYRITVWTIIVLLWFYAFLAGLSPSILRSVLMLSLYTWGKSKYYRTNTYNILAAAAFIELCIYPLHVFTASFILSYAAVLAIVYLQPRFKQYYTPKTWIGKQIWDVLIVSVAAQIGTLPFTLYFFGQTSNYFALTNLTILPLSYLIMALAVPLLLFSAIPIIGDLFAWMLQTVTHFTLVSVQWIEQLPGAVSLLQFTPLMLICFLVFIGSFCLFFARKKYAYLVPAMLSLLLFISVYAWHLYEESKQDKCIVFSSRPHTTLLFQHGRNATLLTNDTTAALQTIANYCRYHYVRPTIYPLADTAAYSFKYQNKEFLILNAPILENKTLTLPLHTDVLILGNIGRVSIPRLLKLVSASEVIALPTLSQYKTNQLQMALEEKQVPFYNVHTAAHIIKK